MFLLHGYDWIVIGLMFDFCGGLTVVAAIALKRLDDTRYESLTVFGSNSAIVRAQLLQEGDAITGGLLLSVGFFLQMWGLFNGAIGASAAGVIHSGTRALVAMLLVGVVSTGLRQSLKMLARRSNLRYGFRNWKPGEPPYTVRPTDPEFPDRQAWSLYERRRHGETDEELLARLTDVRERLGRKYGPQP